MKELRRKVIPDDYTYKGKKVKSFRVIFDYKHSNGEIKPLDHASKRKKMPKPN